MERETAKTDAWGGQAEEALADSLVPTFEAVIPTLWGLPRRNTADGWAGIQVGPSILGSVVGSVTGSVVSPDIDPAAGQASHKINRSRPRKDRMIYSCSLVVILALTAFMEVMKFSESLRACRQNEDWTAEQEYCNGLYLYFIWFPTITKQVRTISCMIWGPWCPHWWSAAVSLPWIQNCTWIPSHRPLQRGKCELLASASYPTSHCHSRSFM